MGLKTKTVLVLLFSALFLQTVMEGEARANSYSEGADFVYQGTSGDDYYDLLGGNDLIYEEIGGDDTYIGGIGHDMFINTGGNDCYIFRIGDGCDSIADYFGSDVIEFGAGIYDTDLILTKDTEAFIIIIGIRGTSDSIKIHGLANNDYKIETFRFADGSSLTSADIDLLYDGTLLLGTNNNDTINGNDLGNIIRAKAGDDIVDGGLGADSMYGGTGNDAYYVDTIGDAVVEYSAEGFDTVYSSVQHELAANVENLTLTGSGDTSAVGNELDNILVGNVGNNIISGGQGNDRITDAAGNDIYFFNLGDGQDTLTDLAGTDSIKLGAGIVQAGLQFAREGDNLVITIQSTTDMITITDWHIGTDNKIERIDFADGSFITAASIDGQLPTANAGVDLTVSRNTPFTLDGSASADPQGSYPLSYAWSLQAPAGSAATLTGAETATPSFIPDLPGEYTVTLVVTNSAGIASPPDTAVFSTVNSAPTAEAGPDQQLLREGETVRLDGLQSWDDDGDPLAYHWSFVTRPEGSAAALANETTPAPSFVADLRGTYSVMLTVRDPYGGAANDSVTISFENVPPVANAGTNETVALGATVTLNGAGSSDANGDALSYLWSIADKPEGSSAVLDDPAAATPHFRADRYGDYRLSLVVSDGTLASQPSTVTVSCVRQDGDAQRLLVWAIETVNQMDKAAFKNENMRNVLTQKLATVLKQVEQGQTAEAAQKLRDDIFAKTDGCGATGAADKNDWLTDCSAQRALYPLLQNVLNILQ